MRRRWLRELRKAQGITQEEMAERIGKDRSAVSKYETGMCEIPSRVLRVYADICQMTMDALYARMASNDPDPLPPPADAARRRTRAAATPTGVAGGVLRRRGVMDEDLLAFTHWLAHATTQIRWRRLAVPARIDTERQRVGHAEATATHKGFLEIPGVGHVPAYKLSTGEVVFEAQTFCRLFGLEEPPPC